MTPIRPIAPDYITLYESPNPQSVFCYSPGITTLPTGRLIATIDLGGPGVKDLPGKKLNAGDFGLSQIGKIFYSDDHGQTWTHADDFPFRHARPFQAGNALYVLGQGGDLMITRSDDNGITWSPAAKLTQDQEWHQAPCNVHYANDCVYLVMEKRVTFDIQGWQVGELAPVLMRAKLNDDLTNPDAWTYASILSFRDTIANLETDPDINYFGVPFYECPYPRGSMPAPNRECCPIGWLETNVVQFTDPNHYWYDPQGKTFHLIARAHTARTGYACIAKVTEQGQAPGTGPMITSLEKVPSGKTMLYTPLPGGHLKFHILFDPMTQLYWLLSSQPTDSMTRIDKLPPNRYNLPYNQRQRLVLHFSKNCIDWCFAALIADAKHDLASCHYASMTFDHNDLHILARSGDTRAASAHNGNLITFHTVKDFRDLVY